MKSYAFSAVRVFALTIAFSVLAKGASADPVSCEILIQDGGVFHQNHSYKSSSSQSSPGLSQNTPDISLAKAQVIAQCKEGEKKRNPGDDDSNCDTRNRTSDVAFKCTTGDKEIQFTCGAHLPETEASAYGTDYTVEGAKEVALANCGNNENQTTCEELPKSCVEKIVTPTKTHWWALHSSVLSEQAGSTQNAKLLPAEPFSSSGDARSAAVGTAVGADAARL